MDAPWRVFLAVPMPPAAREAAAGVIERLRPLDWPIRWTAPENLHLTLHFLGEQPRERVELLRLALPPVIARHPAFALRTGNLGAFPTVRRPRVLWLGLHGPAHRLEALQAELGAALRELEFPLEAEAFHPHVTLGRVRNQGTPTVPLRDLPEAIRRELADPATGAMAGPPAIAVPVDRVELVRSYLSHEGSRYETIAAFPLSLSRPEPEE
ncbi:MAG: RNA 2',3'-cyclic phosphodiesterase [Chloroflexota bacterium]